MHQNHPSDGERTQEHSHPEDIPIVADRPAPAPAAEIPASKGENKNGEQIKWADRGMVQLTAAIAFFGLCAVAVAYLQFSAMRGQLQEMASAGNQTERMIILNIGQLRASARTAQAAEDAAGEARKQLALVHEQMVRDQRAWIGAHIHMDTTPQQTPYFFTYAYIFKNYGKSPAFDVLSKDNGEVFGIRFPKSPKYYKPASPLEVPSKSALFPGDSGALSGTAHITPAQLAEITAGTKWFYSYGTITYKDIFGQTHITHVCNRHGVNPPTNKPSLCDTYNDAN
jgi:hypothetical protein